jgi:hypothetical protein
MREKFSSDNQSEGKRDAARRYNQHVQRHGSRAHDQRDAKLRGKRRIADEDLEAEPLLNGNVVRGID